MMFFSHRGTELTEKNQSPELPGLCVLRASVVNSVFLSSLDGVCDPSRLRASGRPFGKLRVNGRYKDRKRKHRWRGKLAATKSGTGVPACGRQAVPLRSARVEQPTAPRTNSSSGLNHANQETQCRTGVERIRG